MMGRYLTRPNQSQPQYHAVVNPPLPSATNAVQMSSLDLTNSLIRDRLRKLFSFDLRQHTKAQAQQWLRDVIAEYARIQSPAVRRELEVIFKKGVGESNKALARILSFALEDICGIVVCNGSSLATVSLQNIIDFCRINSPKPVYKQYLDAGRLSEPCPRPISLPRSNAKYPTFLDLSDPTVRVLMHHILTNDWKTSYAYLEDLRDWYNESGECPKRRGDDDNRQVDRDATRVLAHTFRALLGGGSTGGKSQKWIGDTLFEAQHGPYNTGSLLHVALRLEIHDYKLHDRFSNVPVPEVPPDSPSINAVEGSLQVLQESPPRTRNTLLEITLAIDNITAHASEAGARQEAEAVADTIGALLGSAEPHDYAGRFDPPHLVFDQSVFDDAGAILRVIGDHLVHVTVANHCFANETEARKDLDVFMNTTLDHLSVRQLKTLYVGYCHQVDISLDYVRATGLLRSLRPVASNDATEMIYLKLVDEDDIVERVMRRTKRDDVAQWARRASARPDRSKTVADLLGDVWEHGLPFSPYLDQARPYQVGRKRGYPLRGRERFDQLALRSKPAEEQSFWLSCRGLSDGGKPMYYSLLEQTSPSKRQRQLEQRSGELFLAILIRSPLSTTHRKPGDDFYHRALHAADDDVDAEEDDLHDDKLKVQEIPAHTPLKLQWRKLLGAILAGRDVQHGEVEIEILHYLGWRGEELGGFLEARYLDQSPSAAICLGYGAPFVLTFKPENDTGLITNNAGFVVSYDPVEKVLVMRPLSHTNFPILPRPPFMPMSMANFRLPTYLSWSVAVDHSSGQGWSDVHAQAVADGSVRVAVSLLKLPSGHVALALPGEGPGLAICGGGEDKARFNAAKTEVGARFTKVHISKEAKDLLNQRPSPPLRIRELDIWKQVHKVSRLSRGAVGNDRLEEFSAGPAIMDKIKKFMKTPPDVQDEHYTGDDVVALAEEIDRMALEM